MVVTLQPVAAFLSEHPPFDKLAPDARREVGTMLEVEYQRRGAQVTAPGGEPARLYLVRSGGLREEDASGRLLGEYGEGEVVGAEAALSEQPGATSIVALEDTLLYSLSAEAFRRLCDKQPEVGQFFQGSAGGRLQRARATAEGRPAPGGAILKRRVGSLLVRPLVSIDAAASIRSAAQRMASDRVSCLLVTGAEELGIMTDRDLRSRVVATGTPSQQPVSSIMSSPVAGVNTTDSLLDASLEMMRRNVHHLAVFDAGRAVGVVTLSDLVQSHVANPVYLLSEIERQQTRDGLVRASRRRADVLVQMVASDASALETHRFLTQIGDSITKKLIEIEWKRLAAQDSVEPQGDYCWMAVGSQARQEHALGSDQDNGLVFKDAKQNASGALDRLAQGVCEGLAACGYPRCPGDIMACVRRWCQPIAAWKQQFSLWIREPSKEAVMRGSIFFDMRAIHGNAVLVEELQAHVLRELTSHSLFLKLLAHDCLGRRPPLGFFRRLIVEASGKHESTLNLKHRGLIPIVDLARLYGLEAGCKDVRTLQRLQSAARTGGLSSSGCSELIDAYEFIGAVRLRLHSRQVTAGQPVNNFLDPDDLTSTERVHLRDAFSVVRAMQNALASSRQLNLLGA